MSSASPSLPPGPLGPGGGAVDTAASPSHETIAIWLETLHDCFSFEIRCRSLDGDMISAIYGRSQTARGEQIETAFKPWSLPVPPQRLEEIAGVLAEVDAGKQPRGLYTTLNELDLGRLREHLLPQKAAVTDADVMAYRWLFIDIDSVKAPGHANDSATDEEMARALRLADQIHQDLTGQGWPEPLKCMSGNGAYLLFRVALPNKPPESRMIQRCLQALAHAYPVEMWKAEVDTKMFNPSRLIKVIGTAARKGPNTPERPWRRAELLYRPPQLEIVDRSLLERLSASLPLSFSGWTRVQPSSPRKSGTASSTPSASSGASGSAKDLLVRFRKLLDSRDDCRKAVEGQGGDQATFSAACIAWRLVPHQNDADDQTLARVWDLMRWYNRERCTPHWEEEGPGSLETKIDSARQAVSRDNALGSMAGNNCSTGKPGSSQDRGGASETLTVLPTGSETPQSLVELYVTKVKAEAQARGAGEAWRTYVEHNVRQTVERLVQAIASGQRTEKDAYEELEISHDGQQPLGTLGYILKQADQHHPPPQKQQDVRAAPKTPSKHSAVEPALADQPKPVHSSPDMSEQTGKPAKAFDPYRDLRWTRMPLDLVRRVPHPLDRAILCELAEALGPEGTRCTMTWAELGHRCGADRRQIHRRADLLEQDKLLRTTHEGEAIIFELPFEGLALDREAWLEWAEGDSGEFIPLFHGVTELDANLQPLDRQVLGLIAFRTWQGKRGTSLGRSTIATALGLSAASKATVAKAVRRLQKIGLVHVDAQRHRRQGLVYQLGDLSGLPTKEPANA